MKSLKSKLFQDNILDNETLNKVSGGVGPGPGSNNTEYKDGRPDRSNSSDGDRCWSIGTKDTDTDCSSVYPGGDDLSATPETSIVA